MSDDVELLKRRFAELARRALNQQRYTYSEFLDLAEQDSLLRMKCADSAPFSMLGGYDGAERKLARFGSEKLFGYTEVPPIEFVRIAPLSKKFADALTHRDFLGALMALGVRRSVLGDIVPHDNCGFVVCLDSVAGYIAGELRQVKRTAVRCEIVAGLPDIAVPAPVSRSVNVVSERLDALVAAVYKLSRKESQALIEQGKVFVDSRLTEDLSYKLNEGSIISVRGCGRFIFEGVSKETKKGRLFVNVRVY